MTEHLSPPPPLAGRRRGAHREDPADGDEGGEPHGPGRRALASLGRQGVAERLKATGEFDKAFVTVVHFFHAFIQGDEDGLHLLVKW